MQRRGGKTDSSHTTVPGLRKIKLGKHLLSTYNKEDKENAKRIEPNPTETEPTMQQTPLSSDEGEELSELDSADLGSDPEFASQDQEQQKAEPQDTKSQKSSSQRPESPPKEDNGPATDDEPQSSSEEEIIDEDSDSQRPKKRARVTYEENKLARGGGNEDAFNMWSSQSSKRAKTSTYRRTPSFLGRSQATPEKSSPQTKPQTLKAQGKKKANKKSSSDSESDGGFVVSQEAHFSCPKISKSSPEFKVPAAVPISSNTYSSLATSSFKEPLSMDLDGEVSSLTSLSSPPSSPSSEAEEPRPALCPMCKKEVDRELLERFLAQPKQRVREQQQFCVSHQQNTAEKEWESQGYPTIDWETFDKRVQKHFPALEKFLAPDCSSYYRNILDEALKSGKSRNFRLSLSGDGLETISCGYYGTKGSGKMLQAITDRFAVKLRRLATSDRIVKKAGVVGYAQSVLVPELAVRLVKEDMGVDDDAARQILRESIALGEKMNPALDDDIPIPDDLAEAFDDDDWESLI